MVAERETTVDVVGTVVCFSNRVRDKGRIEGGLLADRYGRYVHAAHLSVIA